MSDEIDDLNDLHEQANNPETRGLDWDRREDEGTQAFEGFSTYRDLLAARSTARVAQELGKSKTLMDRWCKTYSWVTRARAYDAHLDEAKRAKLLQSQEEMTERHASIANAMLVRVAQAVAKLDPKNLKPQDLSRWVAVAAALERISRQLPDSIIEEREADSGTLSDFADHLEARRKAQERRRRLGLDDEGQA